MTHAKVKKLFKIFYNDQLEFSSRIQMLFHIRNLSTYHINWRKIIISIESGKEVSSIREKKKFFPNLSGSQIESSIAYRKLYTKSRQEI